MGKLGALKRVETIDEGADAADVGIDLSAPAPEAPTSEVKAEVEAAPATTNPPAAAAAPPRAFGFNRRPPVVAAAPDLSDDNDWSDALGEPEAESTAPAADAASGPLDVEAALMGALGERSPQDGPISGAANDDLPNSFSSTGDAAGEEHAASAEAGAEPGAASAEDETVIQGDPILVDMLRVAHDEQFAQGIANDFARLLRENAARVKKLDAKGDRLKELQQQGRAEAMHQAGGGFLGTLFGALKAPVVALTKQDAGTVGRARQRLMDQHSGMTDAMRSRMSYFLRNDTGKRILDLYSQGTEMVRCVHDYNSAVLGAEAAEEVLEKAKAYAKTSGKTLDEVASEIGNRKAPTEILEAFDAVQDTVLADESVKKAKAALVEQEEVFKERLDRINKQMDVLTRAGDPLPAEHHEKLAKALEEFAENTPDPIEKAEQAEEFKKRLRESIEATVEAMKQIFSKIFSPAA